MNSISIVVGLISKQLEKSDIRYFTGQWLEEYVFGQVYGLKEEGVVDDVMMGLKIKKMDGMENELDVAFTKDNTFYHIECKTLGDKSKQTLIKDEVYKKGAISTLLGKGEKRAIICTTQAQINDAIYNRAKDYKIEIFPIEKVMNLETILRERFVAER